MSRFPCVWVLCVFWLTPIPLTVLCVSTGSRRVVGFSHGSGACVALSCDPGCFLLRELRLVSQVFSRYDVPVPPSSASSLSGGRGNAGRQQFQQGGGCLGFPQWVPGNVAQGNQGGAHGVMTGEGNQGGVGSVFTACAGGQAGVPNLAANGQDPSGCAARNLENDPWSAWYGTQNEQANGCGAPNGCGNTGGEQSRFHTVHGPGGMTPQVAAYQQILNLLPAIGGPQLLSLRQVLHDAHGQVRNLPENFGGNVSQPCMGVPQFGLDQGGFIPLQNNMSGQQQQQQNGNYDVFAKSEKWIGNSPVPEVAKWTNRETEVLGWQKYLGELVAWAMQASLELGNENTHQDGQVLSLGVK